MRLGIAIATVSLVACGQVKAPEMDGGTTGAPVLSISARIHDERGDSIDFSTGSPVHTHSGGVVDLGSGCPDVYKYGYLLDPTGPVFGSETSPNPLMWHVSATGDVDASSLAYRVRTSSATLLDWTPVDADPSGDRTVTLYRSGAHGIPELSKREGEMYMDVRARDATGDDVIATNCWTHHPLAAPLIVSPLQKSELFLMTLGKSAVSMLLNDDPKLAISVFRVDVDQTTTEPVTLRYAFDIPTPSYYVHSEYHRSLLGSSASSGSIYCGASTATFPACSTSTLPSTITSTNGGTLSSGKWSVVVYSTGNPDVLQPCDSIDTFSGTCTIPARTSDEAQPHRYTIVVQLYDVTDLWPSNGPFYDYALPDNTVVTGDAPVEIGQCTAMSNSTCTQWTDYDYFHALTSAELNFGLTSVEIETRTNNDLAFQRPAYVDPSTLSFFSADWTTSQTLP